LLFELGRVGDDLRRETRVRDAALAAIGDGVIVLRQDGAVESLNAVAARLLAAANPTTLDDWPDLAALARGGESQLTAVRLPGGACLARARRVRSDIGAPTGVIVALTETRAPSAPAPPPAASFDDLIGSSPAMRKRLRAAETAALRGSHLLIGGE